jgi:hypothetical protein
MTAMPNDQVIEDLRVVGTTVIQVRLCKRIPIVRIAGLDVAYPRRVGRWLQIG